MGFSVLFDGFSDALSWFAVSVSSHALAILDHGHGTRNQPITGSAAKSQGYNLLQSRSKTPNMAYHKF